MSSEYDFAQYSEFDETRKIDDQMDQDIVFVCGPISFTDQLFSNVHICLSLGCCYMQWIDKLLLQLTAVV